MTDVIEYRDVVDKAAWERGPWDNEPDKKQWQDDATGLPCLIVRGPHGALCGYVGVPSGHKWHGVGYDDCRLKDVAEDEYDPDSYVDVHGGLTFADGCGHGADPARGICHVPSAGEPDDVWWLGFDCAHCNDLTPKSIYRSDFDRGDVYRDQTYVEAECAKLAKQIASVA